MTTEDAVVVQFETDAGALGSLVASQVSAGRKNRLWIEFDGADESLAFDHEQPEELWCGRREAATILPPRPRDPLAARPRATRSCPAGTPRATRTASTLFVADVYDGDPQRRGPRRACPRSPTACARR